MPWTFQEAICSLIENIFKIFWKKQLKYWNGKHENKTKTHLFDYKHSCFWWAAGLSNEVSNFNNQHACGHTHKHTLTYTFPDVHQIYLYKVWCNSTVWQRYVWTHSGRLRSCVNGEFQGLTHDSSLEWLGQMQVHHRLKILHQTQEFVCESRFTHSFTHTHKDTDLQWDSHPHSVPW